MAMTEEQNASIRAFMATNPDPQTLMKAMTDYGVGLADLSRATGPSATGYSAYLQQAGAPVGFGGPIPAEESNIATTQITPAYGSNVANSAANNWANMPADNYQQYLQKAAASKNDPTAAWTIGSGVQSEADWNATKARAADEARRGITFGGGGSPSQSGGNLGFGGGGYGGGGSYSGSSSSSGTVGGINPYLDDMAKGITHQVTDNYNRNIAPQNRSGAMAAGGFGGSRQGVVEANALNDMNRGLGANLANLYGQGWQNGQQNSLQQQSINNSYDLGIRNNNLGYSNLDSNNAQFGANLGLNTANAQVNWANAGVNAANQMQNTPTQYQTMFGNQQNAISGQGTTTNQTTNMQGNPWLGAIGGLGLANQWLK